MARLSLWKANSSSSTLALKPRAVSGLAGSAVTRLPPGPVCHVAYIDVQANANANELARNAADEFARGFNCGKDEVKVIGASGRAVELAKR